MIHQLIFARPRPGMSEQEFQDYWINFHAIEYASKISQFKRYRIDSRIPLETESEEPLFSGVAEIWFKNEEEVLASVQSKEYIEGARRDEPNWAAFWRTVALDTTAHIQIEGKLLKKNPNRVKLLLMVKRKAGMTLPEFRREMLESHAPKVMKLPGLKRYLQCHVRDSAYVAGEAVLDCVSQLWFEDVEALKRAYQSSKYKNEVLPDYANLFESKYIHTMITTETWIIGPEFRQ